MADTFARMQQIYATTSGWAANNIVLQSGEIGVEVISASDVRMKVGDGVSTFSALPYAASSSSTINAATQAALDAKLALAGGTMTGLLVLSGDPSAPLGAVTRQYVDNAVTTLSTSLSGKLNTTGGTLTGLLTLNADPASALQAATKGYVDSGDALKVSKSGDTMTGALVLAADPANALEAATKGYVDSGPYQTTVGGSSAYAGKVPRLNASGVLDSSVVPPAASYLGTVNLTVAYALTGTFTAGNYYSISTSGTIEASWSSKLNGSPTPTTCGAGQFIYYNVNGKWDLVGEAVSSTAINGKLDKAGGTMTGALILAANPTVALGAVPKQYADAIASAALPLAGGTMTGAITLPGAPTATNHAATKGYVDGAILSNNRLINGSMLISQTGYGAVTVGPSNGPFYPVDMWFGACTGAGVFTLQRLSESTFGYLRATVTTARATLTAEEYYLANAIEGLSIADLFWGTAAAKTVTLSFDVRSSIAGLHSVVIKNHNATRTYPASFTINAANTWERKTVTIPGDTTGTWNSDINHGLHVFYSLGSTIKGTANAWAGSNISGVTGSVNVISTAGATFDLKDVQFEEGSTATAYERRMPALEQMLCQRYYYVLADNASFVCFRSFNYGSSSNQVAINYSLPVPMRTFPTVTAQIDVNDGSLVSPSAILAASTRDVLITRNSVPAGQFVDLRTLVANARMV